MVDSSAVTAGTNATADQYNNLRKDLLLGKTIRGIETPGATVTINWSDITKGKIRDLTLDQDTELVFSNVTVDQWMLINIIQPAAGGPFIVDTWPTGILWPSDEEYSFAEDANAIDSILFHCTSAGVYRAYPIGADLR